MSTHWIIKHVDRPDAPYFVASGYAFKNVGCWRPMGNFTNDASRATVYTAEEMEFFTSPHGCQWVPEGDA